MDSDYKSHILANFARCPPSPGGSVAKRRSILSNSSSVNTIIHNIGNNTRTSVNSLNTPTRSKASVKSTSFSLPPKDDELNLPSTSKFELQKIEGKKLICDICQRQYVDPRVLPCLHTFCLLCITSLVTEIPTVNKDFDDALVQSVICPTCKFHHTLTTGPSSLPSNTIINNQLTNSGGVLCDLCAYDVIATGFCNNCNKNVCPLCWDSHLRQRMTSAHKIVNSLQAKMKTKTPTNCVQHNDYPISMFCLSCSQKICRKCYFDQHQGHNCEHIDILSRTYTKSIQDALARVRPATEQALNRIEQVRQVGRKIEIRSNIVQKEVEAFIDIYKQSLDEHRLTLLQQVSKSKQDKIQIINAQQLQLERRIEEADHTVKFAEDLLVNAGSIEILNFHDQVLSKLEWCVDIGREMEPRINDCIQFLPHEQVPATVNKTPLYGMITTQTVSAKNSFLITEDLLNIRVHSKVQFMIEARDVDNYPLCHGGEKIVVELRYKDSTARTIPVTITDHRDGTYSMNFIPDAAGELSLSVVIKSKHIKGSPFSLVVRTVHPHNGMFHCCSFCSSNGNKQVICGCGARMPGYKGCGHGHEGHPGRRHWSCCGNVYEHSECDNINPVRDK